MTNSLLENKNITIDNFKKFCNQCEAIQTQVLLDIIGNNAETTIGQKYNFNKIATIDDFQKKVPVMEWKDIEDYAKETEKGTPNILFNGIPKLFIITSGTTGTSKIFPESKNGLIAKNITTTLRLNSLLNHLPNILHGKILPMANSAVIGETVSGIPYGTASGITLINASEKWLSMVAYPIDILKLTDPHTLDYVIMRFSIENDIRMIICNNAGRLEQLTQIAEKYAEDIIKDIEIGGISDRFHIPVKLKNELLKSLTPNPSKAKQLQSIIKATGSFTPKEYWSNLQVISCWLAGSVGNYVKNIKHLFSDNIQFMDCGYGATEGKFNIPLELNIPAGPLAIHSGFFEFTSLDDKNTFLTAHQLEDGKIYEIYCTTYSGLYRYAMHDIIKVNGFTGTTPNIQFESKTADFANLCGEKLSPVILNLVIKTASEITNTSIRHWCLVVDQDKKCYNFCLELTENNNSLTKNQVNTIAKIIEKELYGDGTLPYPVFRKQNLINPATVTIMTQGWYKAWFNSKKVTGISSNQIKLPLVCKKIPLEKYLLEYV
jgi:hypothetical protein